MKKEYIIVGSGTAGLNAYRALEKAGKDVLIIGNFWGTTCAHVGCMPSKAFIAEAKRTHNYEQSIQYARRERDRFVSYVVEGTENIKNKIHGTAESARPGEISVNGQTFEYNELIVATGTTIRAVPESIHNGYDSFFVTSDDIFNRPLIATPEKMLVIGTGVIGLELGNAFEHFGTHVDYVNLSDTWGILEDSELKKIHRAFHSNFPQSSNIRAIRESNGALLMEFTLSNGQNKRDYYDLVLWTAGRTHNIEWMDWNYTEQSNVHLIGDVNGERPLLHEAAHQGEQILQRLNHTYQSTTSFNVVFSTLQQAKIGDKSTVDIWKRRTLDNQGRARLEHINEGGILLGFDKKERLVYAEIVNAQAEHLGHFLMIAIVNNMTISQLQNIPYYHPTIYEAIKNML